MDSYNSGSMNTSSGEEEDNSSHPIQPLLNRATNLPSSSFFDQSSNFLDVFSQLPPNPSSNLDMGLSRPDCTILPNPKSTDNSTGAPVMAMKLHFPSENSNVIRSSKKRTRASRRAPTTVLTTDTSNFRAMVQEFTGIPASPFSASSTCSGRLDFYSMGSAMRHGPRPIYPLRPFAQRVPVAPISSSSSMVDPTVSSIDNFANVNSTANNYQLPALSLQNPITPLKSLVNSPVAPPVKSPLANFEVGSCLRSFNGHFGDTERASSCKLNYSAASLDLVTEKGCENHLNSRVEGTVDSWIFSSD